VNSVSCTQCGARLDPSEPNCADRFSELLALDHSRREPWGSRHGLAFAAYTLQHPEGQTGAALDRCWLMLCRVYISGDSPADVARGLRAHGSRNPDGWTAPPRPLERATHGHFDTTIVDLSHFDADQYAARLDKWCRATLSGWGVTPGDLEG
jgi:hypothetical protein